MPTTDRPGMGRWLASLSLALLAISASASGLQNQFTQDDLPLVLRNETVHTVADPVRVFTQPYWHDPFPPSLYRPMATATLGIEWALGRGAASGFRWGSLLLLIAGTLALFALATRCLPAPWPWVAAAFFAVHPVHAEALAPAVNQGELAVGLLALLAAGRYLRDRRAGTVGWGTIAAVTLACAVASLFKENGLVLPGLLIAAELTLLRSGPGVVAQHDGMLRRLWLCLALTVALVLAVRAQVLDGLAIGAPPAEALAGHGMVGRTLTMLGVIPEWIRLLLWPAHLQADYGPNEIVPATGGGASQLAGCLLLLLWGSLILRFRRRQPVIAFGLLWMAVALVPVSNVLVPTGIVLAERTLFLASCGAVLALAGTFAAFEEATGPRRAVSLRRSLLAASAALILLGAARSATRLRDWRDQRTLLSRTVEDAPRSYTAHLAYSRFLEDSAGGRGALEHFRQAVSLKPGLPAEERMLADRYREAGLCGPAVRRYRRLLALTPADSGLRRAMEACPARGSVEHPTNLDSAHAKP